MMAVPKRLLPRAVDRNTLRRVVRESWRLRMQHAQQAALSGGRLSGEAPPVERPIAARWLLNVRQLPLEWKVMAQGQRKRFWRAQADELFARWPQA